MKFDQETRAIALTPHTMAENHLAKLERVVKKHLNQKGKPSLATTISANGYFAGTARQQIEIIARILCDLIPEKKMEPLIEDLSKAKEDRLRALAVACVYEAWSGKLSLALKWLKKTAALPGYWPQELSQSYLRQLTHHFGINTILPKVKGFTRAKEAPVRRLAIEALRPRGAKGKHLLELKENPLPLRGLIEDVLDDSSTEVNESVSKCLADLAGLHGDTLARWCQSWQKPSASPARAAIIKKALTRLVKQGHPLALKLAGFSDPSVFALSWLDTLPANIAPGDSLRFEFAIENLQKTENKAQLMIKWVEADHHSQISLYTGVLKSSQKKTIVKSWLFKERVAKPMVPGEVIGYLFLNGVEIQKKTFNLVLKTQTP